MRSTTRPFLSGPVALALAVALGLGWPGSAAWSQTATIGGGAAGGGDDTDDPPIEVTSDNGIEWHRDTMMYVARGNALAVQGEDRVYGDVLVAHYRETEAGTTEIWRMEARGHARIVTPSQTVTGGLAIYETDKDVLVVTGPPLRMETPQEVVTATDSLEYWGGQRMAVARGDGYAVRANGDTIRGDVLTGYFAEPAEDGAQDGTQDGAQTATGTGTAPPRPASGGDTAEDGAAEEGPIGSTGDLERMEAFGSVVITTVKEVVRGDQAVYDVPAGTATVVGNVTISTDTDQFAGDRAVMDLDTGVSTLMGGTTDDGRARALIAPSRPADTEDTAGDGPAEP